jgi:hypothetical protein
VSVIDSTSTRNKPVRVSQPSRTRTVQLKNIAFKYPKPSLTSTNTPIIIKDRMKQPVANDKTRCAVLISTNGKLRMIAQSLEEVSGLLRYFSIGSSCIFNHYN